MNSPSLVIVDYPGEDDYPAPGLFVDNPFLVDVDHPGDDAHPSLVVVDPLPPLLFGC